MLLDLHTDSCVLSKKNKLYFLEYGVRFSAQGYLLDENDWILHKKRGCMFVNLCLSFQVIYWCLKLDVEIACCMSEGGSRGYVLSLLAPSLLISAASRRRRQWHPTPVLCLERPMDGGAWWAAVHGVSKSWTQLSDFPFTFHFHTLEKEMATHSSVLAWRIPGMGEPGGLPSMGSHRVGHD